MRVSLALVLSSLLASTAFAADYSNTPPYVPTPMPDYNAPSESAWNRPYLGIFGGVGNSKRHYVLSTVGALDTKADVTGGGLEMGLRAGYDHVEGQFLIGAVADFAVSNNRSEASSTIPGFGVNSLESRLDSFGTLRIRAGFLPHRNLALYAHGGGVLGNVSLWQNGAKIPGVNEDVRGGYVVGVGSEYAVHPNVTFNTEYSYLNLSKFNLWTVGINTLSEQVEAHRLTTGVNFRF